MFTRSKILVIDDATELLTLMKCLLEGEGFQVFCAKNGADGIRLNEQENPDLIVLDLHMPEMDGIETLRQIRKRDSNVRVVILTGYKNQDSIKDAVDLNVSKYLSKPFDNEELIRTFREII